MGGGMAVVCKRSEKKRQARKLEKRDDVREMQKMMEERKAAAAEAEAYRPEPPPPPESPAEAASASLTRRCVSTRLSRKSSLRSSR